MRDWRAKLKGKIFLKKLRLEFIKIILWEILVKNLLQIASYIAKLRVAMKANLLISNNGIKVKIIKINL